MTYETTTDKPVARVEREDGDPITVERQDAVRPVERPSRVAPFVAGVLSTLAALAIGLTVFLVVSDSDDDGNIDLNVPSVDVDVNE